MTYNEATEILKDNFPYCDQSKKAHEYDECSGCSYMCLQKEAFDMAIEALEKCQKAEESFEWCTDCKEYDKEEHCCHRFTKQITMALSDIDEDYTKLCEKQKELRKWIETYSKYSEGDFLINPRQLVEILKEFEVVE